MTAEEKIAYAKGYREGYKKAWREARETKKEVDALLNEHPQPTLVLHLDLDEDVRL
jgi:hypothetical protein